MSKLQPTLEILKPLFNELGIRKIGNSFYQLSSQRLSVLGIQASRDGTRFYLNFGSREIDDLESTDKVNAKLLKSVLTDTRINLFKDAQGWLYAMGKVESEIMCRKIREQFHVE